MKRIYIICICFAIMLIASASCLAIKVNSQKARQANSNISSTTMSKVEESIIEISTTNHFNETDSEYSSEPETFSKCEDIKEITEPNKKENYIELTDDEIYELATLVYLEAGAESYECQKAVASVVINRMTTQNKSLHSVIYAKNQFSPAHLISCTSPSESTLKAVNHVITNGPTLPEYVTYFRADYYHSFAGVADYMCIDQTYFSYDISLR